MGSVNHPKFLVENINISENTTQEQCSETKNDTCLLNKQGHGICGLHSSSKLRGVGGAQRDEIHDRIGAVLLRKVNVKLVLQMWSWSSQASAGRTRFGRTLNLHLVYHPHRHPRGALTSPGGRVAEQWVPKAHIVTALRAELAGARSSLGLGGWGTPVSKEWYGGACSVWWWWCGGGRKKHVEREILQSWSSSPRHPCSF